MGIKEKFEIEKAAKNRAYSFIIAMDLLPQFRQFIYLTRDIDPDELRKELIDAIM